MKFSLLIGSTLTLLLAGCATITGSGSSQTLTVQTFDNAGADLDDVKCEMTNDEGTWVVRSPGSVTIHRSNKDMIVTCRKKGHEIGTATVVSRTMGNMFGNIILGGGIGAVIDHNNGTAYEYPGLINIYMGRQDQRIVAADESVVKPQSDESVSDSDKMTMDKAKEKCESLGFKPATESFGACVLKLAS